MNSIIQSGIEQLTSQSAHWVYVSSKLNLRLQALTTSLCHYASAIVVTLLLAGCEKSIEHKSVPIGLAQHVKLASSQNLRIWDDVPDEQLMSRLSRRFATSGIESKEVNLLALSGGGAREHLGLVYYLRGVNQEIDQSLIW